MMADKNFNAVCGKLLCIMLTTVFFISSFAGRRAFAQSTNAPRYERFESERSDKLTGGNIEQAEFEAGQPDIKLTLNVPSFRLTLWQNGREVKSYWIGVGLKEYPIYIGDREADEIIWNPAWICVAAF